MCRTVKLYQIAYALGIAGILEYNQQRLLRELQVRAG